MNIIGKKEVDTVTDVVCDVCLCSTQIDNGGHEFATIKAHWGYGAMHDGERYELHLCEGCFFETVAYLRQQRRTQNLFSDSDGVDASQKDSKLGLLAQDDYFRDGERD